MKHTPGPWTSLFSQEEGAYLIRTKDHYIATTNCNTSDDEVNARLIAAAPELLKACECLLDRYVSLINSGDCGNWNIEEESEVLMVRSAITKATGQP